MFRRGLRPPWTWHTQKMVGLDFISRENGVCSRRGKILCRFDSGQNFTMRPINPTLLREHTLSMDARQIRASSHRKPSFNFVVDTRHYGKEGGGLCRPENRANLFLCPGEASRLRRADARSKPRPSILFSPPPPINRERVKPPLRRARIHSSRFLVFRRELGPPPS